MFKKFFICLLVLAALAIASVHSAVAAPDVFVLELADPAPVVVGATTSWTAHREGTWVLGTLEMILPASITNLSMVWLESSGGCTFIYAAETTVRCFPLDPRATIQVSGTVGPHTSPQPITAYATRGEWEQSETKPQIVFETKRVDVPILVR